LARVSLLHLDDTEQAEINGGGGDDTLTVNDLSATDMQTVIFNGGDGNDILDASHANVPIIADGGAGDDLLIGSTQDDQLFGGDGNDTLIGNGGNDVLIGGAGDDLLIAELDSDISSFITVESFDTAADVLQLQGGASDYVTNMTSEGTGIYIDTDGSGTYSEGIDELAVQVTGPSAFSLDADYVNYV
jgi:Ca2+-binding RTX toxin-like protein